jgi:hypothetical protein
MPTEQEIQQLIFTSQNLPNFDLMDKVDKFEAYVHKTPWGALALEAGRKILSVLIGHVPAAGGVLQAGWNAWTQKDPPGAPIEKGLAFMLVTDMYVSFVTELVGARSKQQGYMGEEVWKTQCRELGRAKMAHSKALEQLNEAKKQMANLENLVNNVFTKQAEEKLVRAICEGANPATELTEILPKPALPKKQPPPLPKSKPPALPPTLPPLRFRKN